MSDYLGATACIVGIVIAVYLVLWIRQAQADSRAQRARWEPPRRTTQHQQPAEAAAPRPPNVGDVRTEMLAAAEAKAEAEAEALAQVVQGREAWLLAIAEAVNMHRSSDDLDQVEEWVRVVVELAMTDLAGKLAADPLHSRFEGDERIPPKLRARRFYEAIGPALGSEGLAQRPSNREGWQLTDVGREFFGWQP